MATLLISLPGSRTIHLPSPVLHGGLGAGGQWLGLLWLSWRDKNLRPGYLSHVGVALASLGAAVANGFERSRPYPWSRVQPVNVLGNPLTFTDIHDTPKGSIAM